MGKSYVISTDQTPLLDQTIGQALDATASEWGDHDAIIDVPTGIRRSYEQLRWDAESLAGGLLELGLVPGDRVGIWAPNCYEWILTQFATAKAGLILVNINPAYRVHELEYALNKVECRALVMADAFKSSLYVEMLTRLAPELTTGKSGHLNAVKLPHLQTVIVISENNHDGCFRFDSLLQNARHLNRSALQKIAPTLKSQDPINIQFTSGTTGSPKGATLTHHNILNNGYFVGKGIALSDTDRICLPVPLYHCFGMVMGVLAAVTHGATVVLPAPSFEPSATVDAINQERCTALYGVPTMFLSVLEAERSSDIPAGQLRTGIMAGSLCPETLLTRVINELSMNELTICYGMTETSPVSFQTSPTDTFDKRTQTVGRIHPHVEVKIIDDNGQIVPTNTPGELCTRGYSVMRGYWNDEEKSSAAIDADGWMHTGDLATLDEDGYCRIVGRIKDMIIRGGENIYPKEIEDFLYAHPDILDAQVIGVPDKKYGEELCAWVQSRADSTLDEESLKAFCKDNIAHFKVPRYILFVNEYPMTVTGKIQKYIMREQSINQLGLEEQ